MSAFCLIFLGAFGFILKIFNWKSLFALGNKESTLWLMKDVVNLPSYENVCCCNIFVIHALAWKISSLVFLRRQPTEVGGHLGCLFLKLDLF